jgi:hypothetical protein
LWRRFYFLSAFTVRAAAVLIAALPVFPFRHLYCCPNLYTMACDLRLQSGEFEDANHCPAGYIEHFHDFRVVRPFEVPQFASLVVFAGFSLFYLKEEFKWNYLVAFSLMVGAVFFMFKK